MFSIIMAHPCFGAFPCSLSPYLLIWMIKCVDYFCHKPSIYFISAWRFMLQKASGVPRGSRLWRDCFLSVIPHTQVISERRSPFAWYSVTLTSKCDLPTFLFHPEAPVTRRHVVKKKNLRTTHHGLLHHSLVCKIKSIAEERLDARSLRDAF